MRKQFVGLHFYMGELMLASVANGKWQVGRYWGREDCSTTDARCLGFLLQAQLFFENMRNVLGNQTWCMGVSFVPRFSIHVAAFVATSNRKGDGCKPQLSNSNQQLATSKRNFIKTDSLNAIFVWVALAD